MCAYNRLNNIYACENSYLLNDELKKAWDFPGWVMPDRGAAHSAATSALVGLDQEMPGGKYFDDSFKAAVGNGEVPMARLNDMVHHILRTEFAFSVFDHPPVLRPVNPFIGAEEAQRAEEAGIVLLRNANSLLPLDASRIKTLAVIGEHAEAGVLSGSGSDQVTPAGGTAVPGNAYGWHPSSPLRVMRARLPNAPVMFDDGIDIPRAAKLAASVDVAVLFVHQHTGENYDVRNLLLPHTQNEMIAAVAAANPRCIVVLQNGGPLTMSWIDKVGAVVEAWYPGIRGSEAVASIIFGDVNPSGRLPVTFPKREADLPHPSLTSLQYVPENADHHAHIDFPPFDVNYDKGLKVGYKWFEAEHKEPLFPFGFGLCYTRFAHSGLKVSAAEGLHVTFEIANTGERAGAEVAQVYAQLPQAAGAPFKRLIGWEKVPLAAHRSKTVSIDVDPQNLAIFNVQKNAWGLVPGDYTVYVGSSAESPPTTTKVPMGSEP